MALGVGRVRCGRKMARLQALNAVKIFAPQEPVTLTCLFTPILRGERLVTPHPVYSHHTPTLAAVSRRRPCYVPCGGIDELVHNGLQQAARPAQLHPRSVRRARLARSYDLGVERHLGWVESGEVRGRRTEAAGAGSARGTRHAAMRHAACGMRYVCGPVWGTLAAAWSPRGSSHTALQVVLRSYFLLNTAYFIHGSRSSFETKVCSAI